MTVLVIILLILFIYICIGAFVSYCLYKLYSDITHVRYGEYHNDKADYCVFIGIFWPFAAPFAFALYFAQYGIPNYKKRGDKK